MATPKRKTSHARKGNRKAHWLGAFSAPQVLACPRCGEMAMNFRACPSCGTYKGRQIVKVENEAGEK